MRGRHKIICAGGFAGVPAQSGPVPFARVCMVVFLPVPGLAGAGSSGLCGKWTGLAGMGSAEPSRFLRLCPLPLHSSSWVHPSSALLLVSAVSPGHQGVWCECVRGGDDVQCRFVFCAARCQAARGADCHVGYGAEPGRASHLSSLFGILVLGADLVGHRVGQRRKTPAGGSCIWPGNPDAPGGVGRPDRPGSLACLAQGMEKCGGGGVFGRSAGGAVPGVSLDEVWRPPAVCPRQRPLLRTVGGVASCRSPGTGWTSATGSLWP